MIHKQLSKRELKYRIKFIQENHYNKFEQRIFDDGIRSHQYTYRQFYKEWRSGRQYWFILEIVNYRASMAVSQLGRAFKESAKVFGEISCSYKREVTNDNQARQRKFSYA